MSHYDVIVVGAGVEGSSTALESVRRGYRTLLIEQFPLPHSRGSSHGASRITRKAYNEAEYTKMMAEGYQKWEQLEKETGMTLYRPTGLLVIGEAGGEHIRTYEHSLSSNSVPHRILSAKQLCKEYPGVNFPDNYEAVLDPGAGVLYADRCLRAIMGQFIKLGGVLKDNEPMEGVVPVAEAKNRVKIRTSKATYSADRLILCLGPWAGKFLRDKLGLTLPLKPLLIKVFYWREQKPNVYSADNGFPCIMFHERDPEELFFSLPIDEYGGLMKFAIHLGPNVDPDHRDAVSIDWVLEKCKAFNAKHLPHLEAEPSISETCIYTLTPDENPILDKHPNWSNIVIGAGFSGHGFKLGPVVGGILMDLAFNKQSRYNMNLFKISRFAEPCLKSKI